MSIEVQKIRFRVRRRTAASWTALNEVLLGSEIGHESDTDKLKIGDGTTPWNSLPYINTGGGGVVSIVPGYGVLVDDSDPANPVISAPGGGGDPSVAVIAAEGIPAMTPAHLSAAGARVADATLGRPANGFVRTAVAPGDLAQIYASGLLAASGLTAGATYYLRTAGAIGAAMLGVGEIRQPLGVAISTTELAVSIGAPITRVS